jgi:ribose 5-phosphate isomerase A
VDTDAAKRAAGEAAAAQVQDGMRVGLGSGSTARWFTLALARRVHAGLRVRVVGSSASTEALASEHGLELVDLDRDGLDLTVDGADCVDPDLRLIKGAGGAMVRERVVAAAARRFVVVVDETKLCDHLGGAVPVEVLPFGAVHTLRLLETTGAAFTVRTGEDGRPACSDNGNLIADGDYGVIGDPEGLSARLDALPGVVGHGLFLGMADAVVVGHADGTTRHISPR